MQQLARIRKPITFNLYIQEQYINKYYDSWEDIKQEYENLNLELPSMSNLEKYDKYRKSTIDLFYKDEYYKYCLSNLKYHIIRLLKEKGYYIFNYFDNDDNIKYEYNKLDISNKDIDQYINNYFTIDQYINNSFYSPDEQDKIKEERQQIEKRFKLYPIKKWKMINKEIYNKPSENPYIKWIFDDKKYEQLINFTIQQNKNYNKVLFNMKDIDQLKIYSNKNKIYIMDLLHDKLKLKWWNLDFKRDVKKNNKNINIDVSIIKQINKVFRITKKYELKYNDLYIILLNCYNNMWKDIMTNEKRFSFNNIKYRCKKINNDKLNELKYIYSLKHQIIDINNLDFI